MAARACDRRRRPLDRRPRRRPDQDRHQHRAIAARLGGAGHAGERRPGDHQGPGEQGGRRPRSQHRARLRGQPGRPREGPRGHGKADHARQGRRRHRRPPELGVPRRDRGGEALQRPLRKHQLLVGRRAQEGVSPGVQPGQLQLAGGPGDGRYHRRHAREARDRAGREHRLRHRAGQGGRRGAEAEGAERRVQVRDARSRGQGLHPRGAAAARQSARCCCRPPRTS